jgi:PAS domain S-box-containing protein
LRRFSELVDIQSVRRMLTCFHKATNVSSAVYEKDGTKLATSGWASVCINFHRRDPRSRGRCIESDTVLVNSMLYGRKYCIYRCKNGMIDAVAPVMVRGEHVANVFTGQVFFEEPDLEWFRRQAHEFGYVESQYMEAIRKVPVLQREKLEPILEYLSRFAELLGELGLRHLKQIEAEEALRESERKYRNIFENAVEGVFQAGPDGRFVNINPALARMHGFESPGTMMATRSLESDLFSDPKDGLLFFDLLKRHGLVKGFESQTITNDGNRIWVSVNARSVKDEWGKTYYEGTVENVTERKRAEIEMKATQNRLKTLSRTLLKKMEIERHYVAYELHDEIGQALTAVKLNLESIRSLDGHNGLDRHLDESVAVIDRALQQVRDLSLNLRPSVLDDLGLMAALRWLVKSMTSKSGLEILFESDEVEPRLSREIETTCFRVAQEAITNVLRHAHASKITVMLRKDKEILTLTVSDNGIGFDTRAAQARCVSGGSFGLLGMEERVTLSGGTFLVESALDKGSRIMAHFPLKSARNGFDTGFAH